MDITNLELEDNLFSLIWCSHVLEHIEDDRLAMSELFRVSRPRGLTLVMVPIYGEKTFEDPRVTTPADRLKHFKQEDHVRLFGLDIANRLRDTGFEVEVLSVDGMPEEETLRYGLAYPSTKEIFMCTKS
ncbi:methyltransferase domain-containing protein [Posidoniimonas polymericola]|nr:methyltransferase domain-containing protein [Posidoniimonas polymericola]